MSVKLYGGHKQSVAESSIDKNSEELAILGYTVVENVFAKKELKLIRDKLDALLTAQENETGKEKLKAIHELNLVRCPLAYDDYFLKIAMEDIVLNIIRKCLGNYFVLHLQNGILNMPNEEHHQSSWHRDLPYQDFIISKPIAISALCCIDDFSAETGGTFVVPFSHRLEQMPSEGYISKHAVQIQAKAGSVLIFDSMLFHKAGYNTSGKVRRGINHVYVAGILKQQINLPELLKGKYREDNFLSMFLGYDSETPKSVSEWRKNKTEKQKNRK
jgi:ectoine hydroxylase-related dioxygenase (phytanoyl-CoA dioxygenase family)